MKKKIKTFQLIAVLLLAVFSFQLSVFATEPGQSSLPDGSPSSDAVIVGEDTTLRTANTKYFIMSDGTMTAATYPSQVHYEDDNGLWQDIDNTLVAEEAQSEDDIDGFTNTDAKVSFKFAQASSEEYLFRMTDGEYEIAWGLPGNKNTVASTITNTRAVGDDPTELSSIVSSVKYVNIYNNIDIEYVLSGDFVKENIIVKNICDSYTYSFIIKTSNLTPVLNNSGSIDFVSNGVAVKTIPIPFMYDSNSNTSTDVSYTLTAGEANTWVLTVTANSEWINSAAMPVVIDPQITTSPYVPSGDPDNPAPFLNFDLKTTQVYGQKVGDDATMARVDNLLVIGNNTPYYTNAMAHVTIPGNRVIGKDDFIINAKLTLTSVPSFISAATIGAYNVSAPYSYSSVPTTTAITYNNLLDSSGVENGVYEFDITEAAKGWYNTAANNGIALVNLTTDTYAVLYSTAFIGSYRPAYTIRYRNANGISSLYSYEEVAMGSGQKAYINRLTGNVVVLRDDFCGNGFNLKGVYNSRDAAIPTSNNGVENIYNAFYKTNMLSGVGWKFNAQERISGLANVTGTPYYGTAVKYLYVDDSGMKHYMTTDGVTQPEDVLSMCDMEGTGLVLTWSAARSATARFILTDASQTFVKEYDSSGYITKVTYTGENLQSTADDTVFSYTYIDGDSKRIQYIYNENTQYYLWFKYSDTSPVFVQNIKLGYGSLPIQDQNPPFDCSYTRDTGGIALTSMINSGTSSLYTSVTYDNYMSFIQTATNTSADVKVEFTYDNYRVKTIKYYDSISAEEPIKSILVTYYSETDSNGNICESVVYKVSETVTVQNPNGSTSEITTSTRTKYNFDYTGLLVSSVIVDANNNPIG